MLNISVIVPTKDRPDDLVRAVRSLLYQTVIPAELIIVDQSRDNASKLAITAEYAGRLRASSGKPYLHYILDPEISGRESARNRGIDLATGDILFFLDDDVELEHDCLWQLELAYLSNPEVAGISAIITNYRQPALAFRIWSLIFKRGPFHDERQPIYWNGGSFNGCGTIEVGKCGGGVMSFRRQVVERLRFDESLGKGAVAEDTDFCLRLPAGSRLAIALSARLAHWPSPVGRIRSHWLKPEARGAWFLFMKHWRRQRSRLLLFAWLNVGYALVATLAGLRRLSLDPWRDLVRGAQEGCLDAGIG